jgi:hypothetical protein
LVDCGGLYARFFRFWDFQCYQIEPLRSMINFEVLFFINLKVRFQDFGGWVVFYNHFSFVVVLFGV